MILHARTLSTGSVGVSLSCISICKPGDSFELEEAGLTREAETGSLRQFSEEASCNFQDVCTLLETDR